MTEPAPCHTPDWQSYRHQMPSLRGFQLNIDHLFAKIKCEVTLLHPEAFPFEAADQA